MMRRLSLVALASVVCGKKREKHGADVASWIRERAHHLNKTDEAGDERQFAGVYECPDTGEAYSAAFLRGRGVPPGGRLFFDEIGCPGVGAATDPPPARAGAQGRSS